MVGGLSSPLSCRKSLCAANAHPQRGFEPARNAALSQPPGTPGPVLLLGAEVCHPALGWLAISEVLRLRLHLLRPSRRGPGGPGPSLREELLGSKGPVASCRWGVGGAGTVPSWRRPLCAGGGPRQGELRGWGRALALSTVGFTAHLGPSRAVLRAVEIPAPVSESAPRCVTRRRLGGGARRGAACGVLLASGQRGTPAPRSISSRCWLFPVTEPGSFCGDRHPVKHITPLPSHTRTPRPREGGNGARGTQQDRGTPRGTCGEAAQAGGF